MQPTLNIDDVILVKKYDIKELNKNDIITFTTKDEVYCVALYSYSYGTSMENVTFTLNGGVINGDVAFDGGSAKTYPLTKYTVSSNCVVNGEVYSYGE